MLKWEEFSGITQKPEEFTFIKFMALNLYLCIHF